MATLPFAVVGRVVSPIDAHRASEVGTVLLVLRELAAMLPEPSMGCTAMRGLLLTGLDQYEASYDRHLREGHDWTATLHAWRFTDHADQELL